MKKKVVIVSVIGVTGFPVLLFLMFCVRIYTKPLLDETVRKEAPGRFVTLGDGVTHYEVKGNASDPVVVLIHGGFVPYAIWDSTIDVIRDAGFRVIRYDLFGRGYSDRPRIEYTKEVYVNQLYELLGALNVLESVHVVGISMGGAIAVYFAETWPDAVASLTLIDPVGPYFFEKRERSMPGKIGKHLWNRISEKNEMDDRLSLLRTTIHNQLKYRGIAWSLYSSIRNSSREKLLRAYQSVGDSDIPVLLVWGEYDPIIPVSHTEHIRTLIPDMHMRIIPNAGHAPHYEKPDFVNPILIEFFNRTETRSMLACCMKK